MLAINSGVLKSTSFSAFKKFTGTVEVSVYSV